MFGIIPPFAGFTGINGTVPQLYWNSYSAEQRIRAICHELKRAIEYAESIGIEVNKVSQAVQDIYDGKIDDVIIATVNEWFEENAPELVARIGTLESAVERLNDEYNTLSLRLSTLEQKYTQFFTNGMEIYMLNSRYTLTLVKTANGNFVFDCGDSEDASAIRDFFQRHGVTSITALIITHYHYDHYSGFDTVAEYCDSSTDIYTQMNTLANNGDYQQFLDGRAFVNSVIASHGLKASVIPANGSSVDYWDTKLTFWNTDPSYAYAYEQAWANSVDRALDLTTTPATVTRVTGLNDYSLVTRIDFAGSSYVDTGDIEGAAQQILTQFMDKATVAKVPHHFVNRMGWLQFFETLDPDMWIVSHNNQGLTTAGDELDPGLFMYYYIYRYLLYRQDTTTLMSNIKAEIAIKAHYGNILEASGKPYHYDSFPTTEQTMPCIIPPNYYNANPFVFFTMTLDDFWDLRVAASSYPKFVYKGNYTWAIGKAVFMQQLQTMFPLVSSYVQGRTIFIDFFDLPRIKFHSSTWGYNIIELLNTFTYEGFENGEINYKKYSLGDTPVSITGAWNTTTPLSSAEYDKVKHADRLIAVLSNDIIVPLLKTNSISDTGNFNGTFAGTTMNATGTSLYFISVSQTGAIVANQVILSSGNVNAQTIKEIRVIY